MINSFHYAFKVKDLSSTRDFYINILVLQQHCIDGVLGCSEGRSTDSWVDFDLYGNQLSAHIGVLDKELDYCGNVDGINVPVPHFGCLLSSEQFVELADKLEKAKVKFIVKPQVRYKGKTGQQQTMFVLDFSGNPLEFKSFDDDSELFNSESLISA